jgi:lysophospholipase L1-like esterase
MDPAQTERITRLSEQLEHACRDLPAPYIAVVEPLAFFPPWFDELRRGDGAHPARRGYQRMATIVLENGWWQWIGSA